MNGNVLVSLLKTTVLLDVVEVVSANNNSTLHLGGHNHASQDTSSDGDVSGKRALLVNIISLNGSSWGTNSKTDILNPTHWLCVLATDGTLTGDEDGILGLVSLLVLIALNVLLRDSRYSRHILLFFPSELLNRTTWKGKECVRIII